MVFPALATVNARDLNWSAFVSLTAYNYSTLLGGPLFEEPGWRGFALPRLQVHLEPLPAALTLGIIWPRGISPCFYIPVGRVCPYGFIF